jgi:hypothetical protein
MFWDPNGYNFVEGINSPHPLSILDGHSITSKYTTTLDPELLLIPKFRSTFLSIWERIGAIPLANH